MELTKEQIEFLRGFKRNVDDDNIRYKQIIKETLINNDMILYLLNNKKLEEQDADASDYLDTNILDYYLIHPTQFDVQNFICFEIETRELDRYNSNMKKLNIIFYILCEEKNIKEKTTGIARHDLIAAVIKDIFNWDNHFGGQIHCISDIPSVVDNDYACRTLIFEQHTDNNLAKTRGGIATMGFRNFNAISKEN